MPSGGHSDMMSNIILFLLSLVMFFGTGCSHTVETQASVPAENDLVIQEESVNNSVETGEETVRKGQTEILTQVEGIDTDQADYILEKLEEAVPGIRIVSAESISDKVGNGLQITDNEGKAYNVYMYQSGVIYGIKEISSGNYLYMVYE